MAAIKHLLSHGHRLSNPPPPLHLFSLLRRHLSSEPQPTPPPEQNANSRNPVPIQPVSYPAKPRAPPPEETHQEYPPERQSYQSEARDYARPESRSWARDDTRYNNNANPVISPVSYAARSPEATEETRQEHSYESEMPNPEGRPWSRDEMRYLKDASAVSPVSYAARVAPLPEDRVNMGVESGGRGEGLEWERRRIEEARRGGALRYGRMEVVQEEEKLPFPKFIKAENADKKSEKKVKVIYDVKEAIRLVKVGFFGLISSMLPVLLIYWRKTGLIDILEILHLFGLM